MENDCFRQIDKWKAEREQLIEQEKEEEELRNQIYEKESKIQELLRKRNEIQRLVCSIDSLYCIRLEKLKSKGYKPPSQPIEDQHLLARAREETATYNEKAVIKRKKKMCWV